jgi:citronellyl-CoA dehydrogenase
MKRELFDADHESFRDSVRSFLDREVRPNWDKYIEAKQFPREMWLAFGEAGLLGLEIPEQYGGSEAGDFRYNAVLCEELGKLSMALGSCHGIHADIVAPYLVELTTEEQRERWLPGFVSGEILTAIGMTEPSGGSDLAALKTTAVRDGDDWVLNGSKTFITNGYSADLVVVAARTDPEAKRGHGITLFGVEADMDGFSRGRKLDKVGQDESDTAELFFDDVRVPVSNTIGEIGRGFQQQMAQFVVERMFAAYGAVGSCRRALERTRDYLRERQVFGKPLLAQQYIQFRLAELSAKVELLQALNYACAEAYMNGDDTTRQATIAKLTAGRLLREVADTCMQFYGGMGYMEETWTSRFFRDSRLASIGGGADEVMLQVLARMDGFYA